jgi:hypothetical protein
MIPDRIVRINVENAASVGEKGDAKGPGIAGAEGPVILAKLCRELISLTSSVDHHGPATIN